MNVLIIGVGLIGGSFALALRDRGLAERIEGVEASEEHARRALERGLVDRIVTLEEGLPSADLIVLATPVDTIPPRTVRGHAPDVGYRVQRSRRRQPRSLRRPDGRDLRTRTQRPGCGRDR